MRLPNFKCNSCDGLYNSLDIHFTSHCDNKCPFCIDSNNRCTQKCIPDVKQIVTTVVEQQSKFDDVLFLGGEPCLYLEQLLDCTSQIKAQTNLKVYVTTSVPYVCYFKKELFFELIKTIDGLNISAQHYNEGIGDEIRKTHSMYNRQKFYSSLPFKDKIRITVNLVKPYFDSKQEIINCLHHYDRMGFGSILLRELQHSPEYFVSFEKVMGIKLPSAYAHGCQTSIEIPDENFSTPIILKRSCSLVEESIKASWDDVLKSFIKIFKAQPNNNFGVVWENGSLKEGW